MKGHVIFLISRKIFTRESRIMNKWVEILGKKFSLMITNIISFSFNKIIENSNIFTVKIYKLPIY